MRAVAVRVLHGTRETTIDADGVRSHPTNAKIDQATINAHFELEVTFQCATHESILRLTPGEGGPEQCPFLFALVEIQRLERVRSPIGQAHQKRARRVRTGVLRLITSETRR